MKTSLFAGAVALLAGLVFSAHAALIGTITHDYGHGYSAPSLGSGSCDSLNSHFITVNHANGCQRFFDSFDFGHLNYSAISSFELTVTYAMSGNNGTRWAVRPAYGSATVTGSNQGSNALSAAFLGRSLTTTGGALLTTSYSFDASLDVFPQIVAGESFYLWFSRFSGASTFNLYSATLNIYGTPAETATPVPAPATLALLGLGLLALRLRRR